MPAPALYRHLEPNFHTQYAEVKERVRTESELLPGTPGTLTLRSGTGQGYWYRRYKAVAAKEVEDFVCKDDDEPTREAMQQRIEAAVWTRSQVRQLRTLGMQVADKATARVLVEFHNRRLFKPVPELAWHAQTVPFFDYLPESPRVGVVLARRSLRAGQPAAARAFRLAQALLKYPAALRHRQGPQGLAAGYRPGRRAGRV